MNNYSTFECIIVTNSRWLAASGWREICTMSHFADAERVRGNVLCSETVWILFAIWQPVLTSPPDTALIWYKCAKIPIKITGCCFCWARRWKWHQIGPIITIHFPCGSQQRSKDVKALPNLSCLLISGIIEVYEPISCEWGAELVRYNLLNETLVIEK